MVSFVWALLPIIVHCQCWAGEGRQEEQEEEEEEEGGEERRSCGVQLSPELSVTTQTWTGGMVNISTDTQVPPPPLSSQLDFNFCELI